MPRGRPPDKLTEDVKTLIGILKSKHPDWRGKDIWGEVRLSMFRSVKESDPKLTPVQVEAEVDALMPSEGTVSNYITKMTKGGKPKPSELDAKWRLATLKKYPLAPEVVAKIFELRARLAWNDMTIREAQWVARLSALPLALEALKHEVVICAGQEQLSEGVFGGSVAKIEFNVEDRITEMINSPDGGKGEVERAGQGRARYEKWLANYENTHDERDVALFRSVPESERNRRIGFDLLWQFSSEEYERNTTPEQRAERRSELLAKLEREAQAKDERTHNQQAGKTDRP